MKPVDKSPPFSEIPLGLMFIEEMGKKAGKNRRAPETSMSQRMVCQERLKQRKERVLTWKCAECIMVLQTNNF